MPKLIEFQMPDGGKVHIDPRIVRLVSDFKGDVCIRTGKGSSVIVKGNADDVAAKINAARS